MYRTELWICLQHRLILSGQFRSTGCLMGFRIWRFPKMGDLFPPKSSMCSWDFPWDVPDFPSIFFSPH